MSRLPFEWNNLSEPWKTDMHKMSSTLSKRSEKKVHRKDSMRLSIMSRRSQETKSRKFFSSKKTIGSRKVCKIDPPKLIPLKSE